MRNPASHSIIPRRAFVAGMLVAASLGPLPAAAGHCYYVNQAGGNDANNGLTPQTAWATIGKGVQVAGPGDSVLVADGNYKEVLETVRSGTTWNPILFRATGQNVYISAADDLDDRLFVRTVGFSHVYQLAGATGGNLRQTYFPDIVVNDANPSYYVMTQSDGPITLASTGILNLPTVERVEGSYLVLGGTLYVHPYGNVAPSPTATDFWSNRDVPAFTVRHNSIVLDGFRFYYASSASGAVALAPGSHDCVVRNCVLASGDLVVSGSRHRIVNLRSMHNNYRSPPNYDWVTGNTGTGATILGDSVVVKGGEIRQNWNNFTTECNHLLVDGLILHASPNHNWLPKNSTGLTLRNVVEYNAQDGLYVSSCESLLVENCTFFTGMFVQGYPVGNPIGVGPIMVRNCVFQGGSDYGSTQTGTPADVENSITFENDIFMKTGRSGLFRHLADGLLYDLDAYIQRGQDYPWEPHATMINDLQMNSGFASLLVGGAWQAETDAWDIHIASRSSPAYNQGSSETGAKWDFEHDHRPQGGAYDIGADEYAESQGYDAPPRGNLRGSSASEAPAPAGHALPDTAAFAVEPNHPNPFRPGTTIAYRLPGTVPVRVTVYDAAGREVMTLAQGTQSEGAHRVSWDGTDASGRRVPGGVYLCRVEAGGMTRVLKLVLLP